ncbi:MAG: metallophosphoesterase [Peptococcaceae bacterium]|nr:metallophosphoesterase [Peptococcaceae bacterium]
MWTQLGHRDKKISDAFVGAPEVFVDDSSRIVFMSDIHRGDSNGADAFYPQRNIFMVALKYYDSEGFTYVELGDSDELWENRHFSDIRETYGSIFEMLASMHEAGRYYSVIGNHDIVKKEPKWPEENMTAGKADRAAELFRGLFFPQGIVFKNPAKGWKIHALHGHQADRFNSDFWRIGRFLVRYIWRPLTLIGVKDPLSASSNKRKRGVIEWELAYWAQKHKTMIVAGHTHRVAFPNPGAPLYFNDGCCVRHEVLTAIEIMNGEIALVRWGIKSNEEGFLYVSREEIHGPVALDVYFQTL